MHGKTSFLLSKNQIKNVCDGWWWKLKNLAEILSHTKAFLFLVHYRKIPVGLGKKTIFHQAEGLRIVNCKTFVAEKRVLIFVKRHYRTLTAAEKNIQTTGFFVWCCADSELNWLKFIWYLWCFPSVDDFTFTTVENLLKFTFTELQNKREREEGGEKKVKNLQLQIIKLCSPFLLY